MNATAPPARLKTRYLDEIRPTLIERFGYTSSMQAPKLEKVTLNMGVGSAKQDSKALKAAQDQLATIAGQRPSIRRARKSIAAFKLREGMPVGVAVTLRGERAYEFLDRLISIAIPRIRDFRGLSARSFDGRGNYSLGVREQIIFPEIDYDAVDEVRGLDITITTSAASDPEAYALLASLGMPYTRQGMPKRLQELADDGFGPAAESAVGARRSASAPVLDDAPPQTAEATESDAETELPSTDVSEAELPAGEAVEDEPVSDDAPRGAEEATGSDAETELPSTDVSEAELPVGEAAGDELAAASAEGDSPEAEAVGDELSAASAERDSAEAGVAAEPAQTSSDGESNVTGQSGAADADEGGPEAGASGNSVDEDPEDDGNDTEDTD
jgi:large subunit ribosomal protein L5